MVTACTVRLIVFVISSKKTSCTPDGFATSATVLTWGVCLSFNLVHPSIVDVFKHSPGERWRVPGAVKMGHYGAFAWSPEWDEFVTDVKANVGGKMVMVNTICTAQNEMKKRSKRRKQCARAGCSKVRTPLARPLSQTHRQDRLQYTAPQLASAQCNKWRYHKYNKKQTENKAIWNMGRHIYKKRWNVHEDVRDNTMPSLRYFVYYAPLLIGGDIKRWFCLTSVCRMSVAYIGPKSRTERPRKTKIGTEVANVTRDSDTTFRVKRSKVKVTRSLYSPQP